ncbi:MAG: hypothetical protein ACK5Y8_01195 [Betaproteobacteria bacterium]|jgi:hypothetical protein
MNLLQRFCTAVIDASDSWGASMQGVDVKTHRENLYGHPDGIVAARVEGTSPRVQVEADGPARDPFAEDQDWGLSPYSGLALLSPDPSVRSRACQVLEEEEAQSREDLEEEQARWRDFDDADRWLGV